MKAYPLVVWSSIALLVIAIGLPIYTATSIPGSVILWSPYLRWLTPAVLLVLLLGLLPRVSLNLLLSLSLATLVLLAVGIGFSWADPLAVILFSFGVSALSIAAIRRSRAQILSPHPR